MRVRLITLAAVAALTGGAGEAVARDGRLQAYRIGFTDAFVVGPRSSYPRCYQAEPFFCGPRYATPVVAYGLPDVDGLPKARDVGAPIPLGGYRVRHRRHRVAALRVRG